MHRTSLPYTVFLQIILAMMAFGQGKPAGEIDVAKCWSYPLNGSSAQKLAADGVRVFLASSDGRVESLTADGKKVWSSEFGGQIASNLVVLENSLYFVTSAVAAENGKHSEGVLRGISKETGITFLTAKVPAAEAHFLWVSNGVLVIVSKDGLIQALDPTNGTIKWRREIADGFVAEPAFTPDRIVVATSGKQIFIVLLASGQIDSYRPVPYNVTAIAASGTYVLVGDDHGGVSVFEFGVEKPRWRFRSGGEISAIIPIGEHVLAASNDNFAYFLRLARGGLEWKRRLSGRPSHASNYMGKYVLVSASDSHSALLLDTANGKIAGQVVFGPDEELMSSTVTMIGPVIISTNEAIYQFLPGGCPTTKSDGPGQ